MFPISSHLAFGILYLYQQSGRSLICKDEDLDQLIDEGFEDFTEEDNNNSSATDPSGVDPHTLVPPFSDSESNDEEEVWKHSLGQSTFASAWALCQKKYTPTFLKATTMTKDSTVYKRHIHCNHNHIIC